MRYTFTDAEKLALAEKKQQALKDVARLKDELTQKRLACKQANEIIDEVLLEISKAAQQDKAALQQKLLSAQDALVEAKRQRGITANSLEMSRQAASLNLDKVTAATAFRLLSPDQRSSELTAIAYDNGHYDAFPYLADGDKTEERCRALLENARRTFYAQCSDVLFYEALGRLSKKTIASMVASSHDTRDRFYHKNVHKYVHGIDESWFFDLEKSYYTGGENYYSNVNGLHRISFLSRKFWEKICAQYDDISIPLHLWTDEELASYDGKLDFDYLLRIINTYPSFADSLPFVQKVTICKYYSRGEWEGYDGAGARYPRRLEQFIKTVQTDEFLKFYDEYKKTAVVRTDLGEDAIRDIAWKAVIEPAGGYHCFGMGTPRSM